MEAYTLNRQFRREQVVDTFESFIWTDRYYGDSDCQIVVPATKAALATFSPGTFLALDQSQEVMMLEKQEIAEGKATISGISLLKWMNNRFARGTASQADRYYNIPAGFFGPGQAVWQIFTYIVRTGGPDGVPAPYRARLLIPNIELGSYHTDFAPPYPAYAIPFGPLYDALRGIAEPYEIGMTLTLEEATEVTYRLAFTSYKGQDRTSAQSVNPIVRFSPEMDSLTDIQELASTENYKTEAWVFAPAAVGALATDPGYAAADGAADATGFDLRAVMVFAEDITTDLVGGSAAAMKAQLDTRAKMAIGDHSYIVHVDGEIVPTSQFQYGRDYSLGDVIEIAGHSGVVQNARITEYIRSHDESGEKAYPSVTMIT